MTTAILWVILALIYKVSYADVFIISIVLTVIGFIGDVLVLPRIGDFFTAIGDFFLALVVVWLLGSNLFDVSIALGNASLICALIIMMGEFFLHRYMENYIFERQISKPGHNKIYYQRPNLLTEAAEEIDIDKISKEIKEKEEQ